jgi:hypothetical protein
VSLGTIDTVSTQWLFLTLGNKWARGTAKENENKKIGFRETWEYKRNLEKFSPMMMMMMMMMMITVV